MIETTGEVGTGSDRRTPTRWTLSARGGTRSVGAASSTPVHSTADTPADLDDGSRPRTVHETPKHTKRGGDTVLRRREVQNTPVSVQVSVTDVTDETSMSSGAINTVSDIPNILTFVNIRSGNVF